MCKECGQVFDTIESLKEHEKSEEEDKELQNKRLWCGFVAFDRNHTLVPQDQKERLIQKIAIPTLSTLAKYASDYDIQLLLEPLNRYSAPYCTTAKEAIYVPNQINKDNFGVLLDTSHMNIEEDSIEDAIMQSNGLLKRQVGFGSYARSNVLIGLHENSWFRFCSDKT